MRYLCLVILLGVASFAPKTAASPWTLKRGDLAVVSGISYQEAEREYLVDGRRQRFPLRGRYRAVDIYMGARFGLTDVWELELAIPFRMISYTADPVILLSTDEEGDRGFDFYQNNTLDFSQAIAGMGDLTLAARRQLFLRPFPLALELKVKSPTGYDRPSGTFGERPKSNEEFLERAGDLVKPENVRDDVTLGPGQLDVMAQVLVGYAAPGGTFLRFDGGYNLRLGGAGDELRGSFKVGQLFAGKVLLYFGTDLTYAVQRGDVIGVSVVATNPRLPARQFGKDDDGPNALYNLELKEVTLDRDAVDVGGGLILRLVPGAEVNVGYNRTVWGRNTAVLDGFYIGFGARMTTY